eukprot:848003-Pelagomonas_calceolata.AAC.11
MQLIFSAPVAGTSTAKQGEGNDTDLFKSGHKSIIRPTTTQTNSDQTPGKTRYCAGHGDHGPHLPLRICALHPWEGKGDVAVPALAFTLAKPDLTQETKVRVMFLSGLMQSKLSFYSKCLRSGTDTQKLHGVVCVPAISGLLVIYSHIAPRLCIGCAHINPSIHMYLSWFARPFPR